MATEKQQCVEQNALNVEVKTFEIRDTATFIPVMCIRGNVQEIEQPDLYLFRRSGWGADQVFTYMFCLGGYGPCNYNWSCWDGETRQIAHRHIEMNWDQLRSGDVIDVQFILGNSAEPKESERGEDGHFYG